MIFLLFAVLAGQTGGDTETQTVVQEFSLFESVDRNEYVLGAGDLLQMVVEGGTSEVLMLAGLLSISPCQVSGDGIIQLSGIGQVSVIGLTIAQAEVELQRLSARYYPGVSVGLSLIQPRSVKVWINGMLERPGQYTLYAINRVSDLVARAGGMSSFCSRTGWMVTARGDSVHVDLHFDRTSGRMVSDPFLDGGAVVSFGLVRDPVYVIRPGVRNYNDAYTVPEVETWEHLPGETVEDLMYRIGGITGNVDLGRSYLVSGTERFPIWAQTAGFSGELIDAGDTLRLVVSGNDIYVAGAVHQRGIIAYSPGLSARVYVERAGGVVYNGSLGGTTLTRDGVEIASGNAALDEEVLPGDVIEVPYSWVTRHSPEIGILATVVGITSTIIYLTR